MQELLSFDDVLIQAKFSDVRSRKEVNTSQYFLGLNLTTPILSSNMDTVTGPEMAAAMALNGGIGCLHRFSSIQDNVKQFKDTVNLISSKSTSAYPYPIVSVGIGNHEYERALALEEAGATHFLIDVAHGAAIHVVEMYDRLRLHLKDNAAIIVGNFSDLEGIEAFNERCNRRKPDAYKVGIGGGSLCTTRVVTGCGAPTLSSIIDCANSSFNIIADGGIRNSGDFAKAIAAGSTVVMLGGLLAGTNESPGDLIYPEGEVACPSKTYRGSASFSSYQTQGKVSDYRSAEGEETLVPCKGPVKPVLDQLMGGLRSSMSYTGSFDLTSFRQNAILKRVTNAGHSESRAHGKR